MYQATHTYLAGHIRGGGGEGGGGSWGGSAPMLPVLVFLQLAAVVGGRLPQLSYLPVLPQQGPPLPPRLALCELETPNLGLL